MFSDQKEHLLVVVLLLQEFTAKNKNSRRALLMFWIVLSSAYTWTRGELILKGKNPLLGPVQVLKSKNVKLRQCTLKSLHGRPQALQKFVSEPKKIAKLFCHVAQMHALASKYNTERCKLIQKQTVLELCTITQAGENTQKADTARGNKC